MWTYNYLAHYGVKGMKWGVRRYQNSDGSLTAAGKKRGRRDVKRDNKTAYELGRTATILGRATAKSMSRTIKTEKRLAKEHEVDPEGLDRKTKKLRDKRNASAATTAKLAEAYTVSKNMAEQHCKSLIDKYGSEAVSSIKYKDVKLPKGEHSPSTFKTMNERTNKMSDYARAGAETVAGTAFMQLMGAPLVYISTPRTTGSKAKDLESRMYNAERLRQKRG